jgi:hypothetical protein
MGTTQPGITPQVYEQQRTGLHDATYSHPLLTLAGHSAVGYLSQPHTPAVGIISTYIDPLVHLKRQLASDTRDAGVLGVKAH